MQTVKFVHWEEHGVWIGYIQDYPDYWTQGETLDEVTANLREAVALHLDGEDMAALGFVSGPTIIVTLELAPAHA